MSLEGTLALLHLFYEFGRNIGSFTPVFFMSLEGTLVLLHLFYEFGRNIGSFTSVL